MDKHIDLYIDWGSQPCRALAAFFLLENIPHTIKEIRILKGQNRSPEYKKINPDQKVPCIVEKYQNNNKEVILNESHTIMRYICDSRNLPDHYYPKNLIQRAKINAYLDWHHTNIRQGGWLVFNTLFAPMLGIKPFMDLNILKQNVEKSVQMIDQLFLEKGKWMVNQDQMSIADISAYCEIVQLKFLNWEFSKYQNLQKWMLKMEKIPEINKTHEIFEKTLKIALEKQKEMKANL